MIKIPTVGPHDINTKEYLLQNRGAVKRSSVKDCIFQAWPGSSIFEILDRHLNRAGDLWLGEIDLGDNVKLNAKEFESMVLEQFPNEEPPLFDVTVYLNQLINEDVEVYKLMVKMGKMGEGKR